jgi:hypothetical protein
MEDPIFDPWSPGEPARTAGVSPQPVSGLHEVRPESGHGTVDFLRRGAVPRLEALCARLQRAHHQATLEDLLDRPERLLRFEMTPWAGPLSESVVHGPALLEIGVGGGPDGPATVWYWLDRSGQAPARMVTAQGSKLTVAWIERIVFDFVGEVLHRS